MSANTATKIPAITQIKGLPPLAVMALNAIKETLEVREGLHEPLDRFVSVRELADLILDDEKIVTYLGSGHNHDARYYTETEWNLTAKGDLNVAQAAGVPGTLGVGTNNQLIRANSGATLGIEYFSLLGTSNQVTVTHNASDATLSLPQDIHSGASPTFTGLTLSNIVAGVADYDKFIVSDGGILKYRTGAEVLSDIDGAPYAFKTITGITNDVVADLAEDSLTLTSANNLLDIVGTAATDTITFTINQANIDHGSIGGLGDSADHTWALLVDGTRPLTADWNIGNFKLGVNTVPSYPFHLNYAPGDESGRGLYLNINPTGTHTAARQYYGIYLDIDTSADESTFTSSLKGIEVNVNNTGDLSEVYALYSFAQHNNANTANTMRGMNNQAYIYNGTVTNAYACFNNLYYSGGDGSSGYGIYSAVRFSAAGKTLGIAYGNYNIVSQTAGTLTTGYLYYGNISGTIGTKWGVYLTGEDKNYFSGQVGIDNLTPLAKLDVDGAGGSDSMIRATCGGNSYGARIYVGGNKAGSLALSNTLATADAVYLTGDSAVGSFINAGNFGIGITVPSAKLDVNSDIIRLRTAKTPASASAAGNAGDICWDNLHLYVAVATNTWKRVAIATW